MTRLGELGLSSYEEKVYRALLTLGSATAVETAAASGVPEGRIYDVLNGLASREIVRTQPTEPTTYAAVDPEAAADRLLEERRRQLDARAERYERLAGAIGPELAATTPSESRFWTAPLGSDAAVSLTGELFEAAGETVRSAMGPPYDRAPWDRFRPEVEPYFGAVDGVSVRCLVSAALLDRVPAATRRRYLDDHDGATVRVTTDLVSTFDLLDGDRVCFHVPHPLDPGERLGAIEVREGDVVERVADLFDAAWAEATPLATALGDRSAGDSKAADDGSGGASGVR